MPSLPVRLHEVFYFVRTFLIVLEGRAAGHFAWKQGDMDFFQGAISHMEKKGGQNNSIKNLKFVSELAKICFKKIVPKVPQKT